jgi:dolichol-phosphate mannosyltransferase
MLSIVIPVFNEVQVVPILLARCTAAASSLTSDYEIIIVDDGSTDGTLKMLLEARAENSRIRILSLSRNFGHQAAFTAGLDHASGDIVAMLDGDLQDPPELMSEMYRMITEEGYEVVNARKSSRKGKKGHNIRVALFHAMFRNISELEDIGNQGNFSMMTRKALDALLSMKERTRYLPGLRAFIGFKQGSVEFARNERVAGKPKMSNTKLFRLAFDAIFSFSRFPMRLCLWLGLIGTVVFLGAGIYVVIAKISGFAVPGWASTLLSIYFLGSIQLVFLGIIGEYLYRNYKESQQRPVYFVNRFYN